MIEGPRAVRDEGEILAAAALADSVFYPGGKGNMKSWFPTLFHRDNQENLRVIVEHGHPVALAGFTVNDVSILGAHLRTASVGSVCTAQSHQGRGLASRLMEDLEAHARARQVVLLLVSGARGLYRRMGYVDAGLYRTVTVESGSALPTLDCEVRGWTEADIPALAAALQAEPVRFIRGYDQWRLLLGSRSLQCKPSRTWVVASQAGIGYLCTQEPAEEDGVRVLKVREIAGPRVGVLASLRRLFEGTGADRISIDTLEIDHEIQSLASAFGLRTNPREFPGTIRIIDRRGFFKALGGCIEERLTVHEAEAFSVDTDQCATFRLGEEGFSLSSDADLAAFVFGSVSHRPPAPGATELGRVLTRLFPFPLVDYGLAYI